MLSADANLGGFYYGLTFGSITRMMMYMGGQWDAADTWKVVN